MELSAEREHALLEVLREEWRHWNVARFRGAMRMPVLRLTDTEQRLGQWSAHPRELSLSRRMLIERAWPAVVEVLKHEMAHQFVTEILNVHDEPPHGPTFTRVCRDRGIDARAAGALEDATSPHDEHVQRIVERATRLLALAGSSNEHEAEAAMRAARRLLAQHNLGDSVHSAREPEHGYAHVGAVLRRVHEWQKVLASLLVEHFFVEAIWIRAYLPLEGRHGSQLELCGTHANLRIAEYVHGYLTASAPRLWSAYKERTSVRGDRDRLTYFSGLMNGFRERLRSDAKTDTHTPSTRQMVRVADAALQGFLRARHPYVRTVRYGGAARGAAYHHGESEGRALTLRRPLDTSASPGPRLLPPRS